MGTTSLQIEESLDESSLSYYKDDAPRCPECGGILDVWHEPDGPDDYRKVAECRHCGITFSE